MKSIYQRLGEAVEKLANAGKAKQYREASANLLSTEAQLQCAERLLAAPVKESEPPKPKPVMNNGKADNHGEEFTESAKPITELDPYRGLGFSESDLRRLKGLPPVGENLTPTQLREWRFLRSINLSESDALKGARKVA